MNRTVADPGIDGRRWSFISLLFCCRGLSDCNNLTDIFKKMICSCCFSLVFIAYRVGYPVFFTARRYAKRGICRGRVSVCLSIRLSVCMSVTLRYCIKTATKRRITQIMSYDSPLTPVFWHQSSRRNSNGFTPYGGDKWRWGEFRLATFDEKHAITRKRYKIDAQLLLKSNRKLYVLYQMAMFPIARDVIYTSRAYAAMSVSVCLSVCLWRKCIGAL